MFPMTEKLSEQIENDSEKKLKRSRLSAETSYYLGY
jgi:hypothetical protein